ncbi:MAG: DnaJ domain-containing protein [Fulvivirga sp.]|nr:DnaJ domain-containing protein [Fulvivirga sp.]
MLNYYDILGINRKATTSEIKRAYKRLALKYHPDRNPGNRGAEEYFKLINEAHQVLSNPEHRKRYDFLLNYSFQTTTFSDITRPKRQPKRQERSVYDRYGRFDWRNAPRYKKAPTYKVDRTYYRVQALTIGVMLLLSAIIYSVNMYINHVQQQERLALQRQNEAKLARAHTLYEQGAYREAIELVRRLSRQNPVEFQFYTEKERMVADLFSRASDFFQQASYREAAERLEVVKDFERPMKIKTWQMLADAYYAIEDYQKAAYALDYLLQRNKFDIRLAVKIARIYKHNLQDKAKAMEYYDEADAIFKRYRKDNYGDAFELVVDPSYLSDFYHELFIERAELNMESGKYEAALTDYNWAIFLRRNIAATYAQRAWCKLKLNLLHRACKDWERALARGHQASAADLNKYCK